MERGVGLLDSRTRPPPADGNLGSDTGNNQPRARNPQAISCTCARDCLVFFRKSDLIGATISRAWESMETLKALALGRADREHGT